ncbi:helix-turn-helix transcriptional regulator [Acidocella facilis]|uniref:helix-turn-helix transcriptional regulator n=1 Tax=Acidocella facilis TaxID=525 RepID=UPI001F2E3A63|nr:helix-turn-helix domain-containing protein [Acidocella facilis]
MTDNTILMTRKDAAAYLGVSLRYMEQLATDGEGPRYYVLSPKIIRYALADLEAWLDASKIDGNTQKAKK